MKKNKFIVLMLIVLFSASTNAQFSLEEAFPNLLFSSALYLTHAGDGSNRIFVVERSGRIQVFDNSPSVFTKDTLLDITDRVSASGEMGLLGLAFHPDYETNGYFYVNYTANNPRRTIISRFQVSATNPDSADKNSEFELFSFNQPYPNHNGGWIGFRQTDGYLYIGTGDGGDAGDPQNNGQKITTMLGKILRIDVDNQDPGLNYAIPPDNPFVDSTGNVVKEIYAWGMRNPWRCSFDPVTDLFWAADVGQNAWEEIDIVEKGKNYGWRCYEGTHEYDLNGCNYPEYINPIWEYDHGQGCSITGGYVYRGPNVPELFGKYIYADYCTNRVWALEYDGINPPTNELLLTASGPVTSFGVDENNELYITSFNGNIYRFVPTVTSSDDESYIPTEFKLFQNYPNPFNPSTLIKYNLPEESSLRITIYNSLGEEMGILIDDTLQAGIYEEVWNADGFPSGVYYVKINAESLVSNKNFTNVIKMLFIK
jgi:glucose/arabinose dehydrogenase